jgi:peptidoglycan/LPS O-acetylase OafA/YrhL
VALLPDGDAEGNVTGFMEPYHWVMTMGDGELRATATERLQLGYIPALDGLRALAVVLVLIHHGLQPLPFAGHVGVDVFFALSGFLITTILISEVNRHGRIRLLRFYRRRAVRLYPALLVAIVVLFPFGLLLRGGQHILEAAWAAFYLTPVMGDLFHVSGLTWLHTWSLGIEEIFYLAWPFALLLLLRRWVAGAWAVALGLGLALCTSQMLLTADGHDPSYFLRAGGVFLGCSLALWFAQHGAQRFPPWVATVGLLAIGVAVVFGSWPQLQSVAFLVAALGTVAMIASIVAPAGAPGLLTAALSSAPAVYIGKISYELYIWHFPVAVLAMVAVGSDRLIDVGWFAIPGSAVLAVATHHALIKPSANYQRPPVLRSIRRGKLLPGSLPD